MHVPHSYLSLGTSLQSLEATRIKSKGICTAGQGLVWALQFQQRRSNVEVQREPQCSFNSAAPMLRCSAFLDAAPSHVALQCLEPVLVRGERRLELALVEEDVALLCFTAAR